MYPVTLCGNLGFRDVGSPNCEMSSSVNIRLKTKLTLMIYQIWVGYTNMNNCWTPAKQIGYFNKHS